MYAAAVVEHTLGGIVVGRSVVVEEDSRDEVLGVGKVGRLRMVAAEALDWGNTVVAEALVWGSNTVVAEALVWGNKVVAEALVWGSNMVAAEVRVWGSNTVAAEALVWGNTIVGWKHRLQLAVGVQLVAVLVQLVAVLVQMAGYLCWQFEQGVHLTPLYPYSCFSCTC